jgi:predicted SpoU family rRNA methylase
MLFEICTFNISCANQAKSASENRAIVMSRIQTYPISC